MLTNQEAEYLLSLEKVLIDPNQTIDLSEKKNRLKLTSCQNSDHEFWVEITTNQKIILKTSIHHLESNSFTGLLRIDFKGSHRNPANISSTLPDFLIPYVGKWFDPTESHMHYYVEGYRPLAWAVPLSDLDFPIKNITQQSDLSDLISNFAERINLKSSINIQQSMF